MFQKALMIAVLVLACIALLVFIFANVDVRMGR